MSFEVVEPGVFTFRNAITSGESSLSKSGKLTFLCEDLELVKVGVHAIVLADPGSLRVAIRAVRVGEEAKAMSVGVIRNKRGGRDRGRRAINVGRAIRRCALEPEQLAGRYTLTVKNDELLIVNLTGEKLNDGKGPKT